MTDVEEVLKRRLAPAFALLAGGPVDPTVRRSQHADFQSDAALALARRLGESPRAIAAKAVAAAELDDVCAKVEISGPGFINLTVSDPLLGRMLAEQAADPRLGVDPAAAPEVVTIDYSAPNAAKEMHVGHLRSTIIGDAAARVLEFQGHRVIRQNHIGEWGTPFGMLIEHLLDVGEAEAAQELSVGDLNGFYQAARRKFDADEAFKDRARRRVVALQSGDPATRRLWEVLIGESKKYFATVYDRLDVTLTDQDYFGESFYNDQLDSVVAELDALGLLEVSDGAKCVFPAGFSNRDGDRLPLIVQKSDGGFGYAATDLATIRRRIGVLHSTRLVYVVGLPQRQHLEMVFEVARAAGWLAAPARTDYAGFGSVLGEDGKILRTRAGVSVRLAELLDEAVSRAAVVVAEKNPELGPQQREQIAHAVGIGAVKYADLSTDRVKDYVFDLDRMVSLDGNTAPYLQYARARICSIFRRAGIEPDPRPGAVPVGEPAERRLALELLAFGGVVTEVAASLEFHRLAHYLFGLAAAFSGFYENCPVLKSEGEVRAGRLVLCDLTSRVLKTGLGLLGIESPEQM
ncbi:MAG TPA: arginine--tRNA ligase [Actinocrinis sp.]|nr:arginine--tRNA ligase [Actinocrinis sp.]